MIKKVVGKQRITLRYRPGGAPGKLGKLTPINFVSIGKNGVLLSFDPNLTSLLDLFWIENKWK